MGNNRLLPLRLHIAQVIGPISMDGFGFVNARVPGLAIDVAVEVIGLLGCMGEPLTTIGRHTYMYEPVLARANCCLAEKKEVMVENEKEWKANTHTHTKNNKKEVWLPG